MAWPLTMATDGYGTILGGESSGFQRKLVLDDHAGEREGGVVITPDPTGIVIKTLLMKEKQSPLLLNGLDDSCLPRSISSIYAASPLEPDDTNDSIRDTKVFLNICSHPLIAAPSKRKGLDDESGKEIDGLRLPMSLGELRPCYDKTGKATIAADCVLNPTVVQEMNSDSNYLHFICDFIVQCASIKFGQTLFGGCNLDRRYKLPRMKYAGFVDPTTCLPVVSNGAQALHGSVAKQRVKRHGGKSSIIEEVDCSPFKLIDNSSIKGSILTGGSSRRKGCRIELFIGNDKRLIPLFEFLRLVSEFDGIVNQERPSTTIREITRSPNLKSCDKGDYLHSSQRLIAPIPLDTTTLVRALEEVGSDVIEKRERDMGNKQDTWSIIARCSFKSSLQIDTPTIELSAFTLFVDDVECVLPFSVDVHQTTATINPVAIDIEIRMPMLLSLGPDPGTRPWELQKALCGGKASEEERERSIESILPINTLPEIEFSTYFIDDEGADESRPLPEDAFHSQDILSCHILHQQQSGRNARISVRNASGRDGSDVDKININFRLGYTNDDGVSSTLTAAGNFLKCSLHDHSCRNFVMGII